jgi:hypothetical protein
MMDVDCWSVVYGHPLQPGIDRVETSSATRLETPAPAPTRRQEQTALMFGLKADWSLDVPPRYFTLEDYEGGVARWCPGCGDHGVLNAVQRMLRDEQLHRKCRMRLRDRLLEPHSRTT